MTDQNPDQDQINDDAAVSSGNFDGARTKPEQSEEQKALAFDIEEYMRDGLAQLD